MFRKLLAVMFAATLMAGGAWGVDVIDVVFPGGGSAGGLNNATSVDISGGGFDSTAAGLIVGSSQASATGYTITGNLALTDDNGGAFIVFGAEDAGGTAISDGSGGVAGAPFVLTITGNLSATLDSATNGTVAFYGDNGSGLTKLTVGGSIATVSLGDEFTIMDGLEIIANNTTPTGTSTYADALNINNAIYTDKGNVTIYNDTNTGEGGGSTGTSVWGGASTVDITGTLKFGTDASHLTITDTDTKVTVGKLEFSAATGSEHTLKVDDGAALTVKENATFDGTTNILTIGGTDSATATFEKNLQFTGVTGEEQLVGDTVNVSALNVKGDLLIGASAGDATTITSAGLDVVVLGNTVIDVNDEYKVDGEDDVYTLGITVKSGGSLLADMTGPVPVKITTGEDAFVTLIDDATIAIAAGPETFTIAGAGFKVQNTAKAATIDADSTADAIIDITGKLEVAGDLTLVTAAATTSMIQVGSYEQNSGTVTQGTAGQFKVTGDATINGGDFKLNAAGGLGSNDSTSFEEGLTIKTGGSLTAINAGSSKFTIADTKTLTLAGGTLNTGTNTGLELESANSSTVKVTENDSKISGAGAFTATKSVLDISATYEGGSSLLLDSVSTFADVQINKGELTLNGKTLNTGSGVTIKDGAYLAAAALTTVNTADNTKAFNAMKGSNIEIENGSISLTGPKPTSMATCVSEPLAPPSHCTRSPVMRPKQTSAPPPNSSIMIMR